MVSINDIINSAYAGYGPSLNLNSTTSYNSGLPNLTVADLLPLQQVSQMSQPSPEIKEEEKGEDKSFKQMANEYFKDYTPAQDEVSKAEKKGKTIGEYLYNNTIGGIRNIGTGLSMAAQDPGKYIGKPVKDFLTDPSIPLAQKISSIPDTLLYKPILGQSTAEIGQTIGSADNTLQGIGNVLKNVGEHHYEGGTLDTALVALPFTKAGQAIDRAVVNVAKAGAKKLPGVKQVGQYVRDRAKIQSAKQQIKASNMADQIEMMKANENLSKQLRDLTSKYQIGNVVWGKGKLTENELADMLMKLEKDTTKNLTENQQGAMSKLDQFLTDYETLIKQYETAQPGNVMEIVEKGVRTRQDKGLNTTYQDVEQAYKPFFDFGEYVDNKTGEVLKGSTIPRTPLQELTEAQPVKSISQILRKDGLTEGKPYNVENALKKVEKKYRDTDPNITGIDQAVDTSEVMYKNLLNDLSVAEREALENPASVMDRFEKEVLEGLPDEYKQQFSDRFARDYEDIYQSRYSQKPTTDFGNPENPKRYTQVKDELKNIKKLGEGSNSTLLSQLNPKIKKVLKEYLTPDEWSSHLEAGSTLGDLSKYMREVQQEAINKMRKPDMIVDSLTGEAKPVDLRDTTFRLTDDGKQALAQMALENSERGVLAREFLQYADEAEKGLLRRIPHGLAAVDKAGVNPIKAIRNRENELATERVYGNASYKDIASEWANPDMWLKQTMLGLIEDKTIKGFIDEFTRTGKPVVLKNSRPEDIRYIPRDVLETNRLNLKETLKKAPDKLPEDANPQDYIPIDKYILKATEELFYSPRTGISSWIQDLASIYNQTLLASGNYLIGNVLGGLHGMITDSGFHIFQDISDAIRTRGQLAKDIGAHRQIPFAKSSRLRTKKGTIGYKALRGLEVGANYTGGVLLQKADAFIQNAIAETRAHSLARQRGIKFEDRNTEWLKTNQTKEDFLKYIDDVKNMSYIYADETMAEKVFGSAIGKNLMAATGIGNPFIRWVDQAAQSSAALYKAHPVNMGYIQGAVLGQMAWDRNVAEAHGAGIDNPQSGKIYKFNPQTGQTKVTTTDMIPYITAVNFPEKFPEYAQKTGGVASIQTLMNDLFSTKDKYGRVKLRSDDKYQVDFQKQVRYKDGIIQSTPDLDEAVASVARDYVTPIQFYNKTAAPAIGALLNQPVYQPYNNQLLASPQGNPSQAIDKERLINRGLTNYERNLREGEDVPLSEEKQQRLQENMVKRRSKAEAIADEKRRGLY